MDKGSKIDDYSAFACIQFASEDQCQFLTFTIIHDIGEFDLASTFIATQDSQTVDSNEQSSDIQWKLFDAQKGEAKSKKILSSQITISYWPDAEIELKTYTERMCLISLYHEPDNKKDSKEEMLNALLLFFVFEKASSNTSPQPLFDDRDYGQVLPIDSSDQGYILWSRPIFDSDIAGLYSEKLVVVYNSKTLDVLDARYGILLRSIACPSYSKLTSFIGSLCIFSWRHEENWSLICILAVFTNQQRALIETSCRRH
ncbi:hypothetical protein BDF19DRAFT_117606 [Syncephalis fuscata]|nr:hypothetical protein BDF19DRAFT_117606 [Syncephalis fuscata]